MSVVGDGMRVLTKAGQTATGESFIGVGQAGNQAAAIAVEQSINMPPTLHKAQGELVTIFVAGIWIFPASTGSRSLRRHRPKTCGSHRRRNTMDDHSRIEIGDGREETRRAVQEQLGALQEVVDRPDVIEVVINRPGEIWVETRHGREKTCQPQYDFCVWNVSPRRRPLMLRRRSATSGRS